MIISASYKTDIPAFYSEWFLRRLVAGHCKMVNPYNGKVLTVPLTGDTVDGFVFWTRNIRPFREALHVVRERGWPFVVQYTITAYPHPIESSAVGPGDLVASFRELAQRHGPRAAVWRYDPIVISSLTPVAYHLHAFAELARGLQGATDEVVVSFAQIYRKTERNLQAAAELGGFTWEDPAPESKKLLLEQLAAIAAASGMQLTLCSQRELLVPGAGDARCVDPQRLADVGGKSISANPKGHRPACGCVQSRDIGDYDSCPHGCTFCYAVSGRRLALARYRAHDPDGEMLFPR